MCVCDRLGRNVAALQSLADIESVRAELAAAREAEAALNERLRDAATAAMEAAGDLHSRVERVRGSASELSAVSQDARKLGDDLRSTAELAQRAIEPVRRIDAAHGRARAALERVDDILDLQGCLGGIKSALRENDLLGAATTLRRFHAVQKTVPVSDADREIMKEAEEQLVAIVTRQFDEAVAAHDLEAVNRGSQLMNLLGKEEQGADQYFDFLKRQVRASAEEANSRARGSFAGGSDDRGVAVNALSAIFQVAADLLGQAEPIALANFAGEDGPARALLAVNEVTDSVAGKVVAEFLATRRLKEAFEARTAFIDADLDEVNLEESSGSGPSVYELDALLDEVALVSQRCVSYLRLTRGKARYLDAVSAGESAAGGSTGGGAAEGLGVMQRLKRHSELEQNIAELAGIFSCLEEAFMVYSTRKAISIDEVMEGSVVSSCVEDIFYVLRKCARRAVATGDSDCACSVVNHVCAVLTQRLYAELDLRIGQIGRHKEQTLDLTHEAQYEGLMDALSEMWPMVEKNGDAGGNSLLGASALDLSTASLGGASPAGLGGSGAADGSGSADGETPTITAEAAFWCLSVNSMEATAENVATVKATLEEEVSLVFNDDLESVKLASCIEELDNVRADFRKRLQTGMTKLCASLSPRLRGAIGVLDGASSIVKYELSEEEFSANEDFNPFAREFLGAIERILSPYSSSLSASLYRTMVFKVAGYLSKQIESSLKRRRVNQLGALQFDRDVRALVTFFVARSSRAVRDKFARLLQCAQVLGVDSPSEISGLVELAGDEWQLSDADAKAIVGLRSDIGE